MTLNEFMQLIKWAKEIGITTLGQLKQFKDAYTDGTNNDLINKVHGCFVHNITFEDLTEVKR
jgi:hypothetical protein